MGVPACKAEVFARCHVKLKLRFTARQAFATRYMKQICKVYSFMQIASCELKQWLIPSRGSQPMRVVDIVPTGLRVFPSGLDLPTFRPYGTTMAWQPDQALILLLSCVLEDKKIKELFDIGLALPRTTFFIQKNFRKLNSIVRQAIDLL